MENNVQAMTPQAAQTNSVFENNTAVKPVEKPTETKTEQTEIEPVKRDFEQLVSEINNISEDTDLWNLTYMLHGNEVFKLKKQTDEGKLPLSITAFCHSNTAFSKLEYLSRCVAEKQNGYDFYKHSYNFNIKNLTSKCNGCTESFAFCPHKMAAYIEYVCDNNQIDIERVYKHQLGDAYVKKQSLGDAADFGLEKEEYDFLDAVSATAAAELIRLKLVNVTEKTDDRILYSYLPICETTKKSAITPMLDYYRIKSGKNDFIRKADLAKEIKENRNCADCLFPQCPDKVAAYILHLSDIYNADPMSLAAYIIQKNKISGMTLRGNFRYYHNLRRLDAIPFTPESRNTLNNIVRYVVNKYTVSKNVPMLPFNMSLYTKDERLADETVAIFKDFLFYYGYYTNEKLNLVTHKFSEGGLEGLVKIVKDIEKPTVLHVKEMALLNSIASNNSALGDITMQIYQLANLLDEKKDKLCLIVSGEKVKLDTALAQYSDFYDGTLSYKITISDMSQVKIVQAVLKELKEKYELEEGFESALEYFILAKYGESTLKSKAFVDWVVQTIVFNHFNKEINTEGKLLVKDIPLAANRRSDEEIWKELNSLTGLENVKNEIRSIEQLLKFQKKMQNLGLKGGNRPNMHMVFAGNPGTGKTTVARLIAEILYNVGFIKQNKLIEVSSKDLIGQYIGQTAPKTAAVCESAYGGVLFIDEAYELAVRDNSGSSNFRSECIAELIKQMEDNRDKLIVILAGYSKEMQELMDSNAGFASRIGRTITFEDYSTEQLTDMFVRLAYSNGMRISEQAKTKLCDTVEKAKNLPNFGNARYVRNLYENTVMEHAKNMIDVDDADVLVELQDNDIPALI